MNLLKSCLKYDHMQLKTNKGPEISVYREKTYKLFYQEKLKTVTCLYVNLGEIQYGTMWGRTALSTRSLPKKCPSVS